MQEFISEDDLQTFEGWLRYHGIDATKTMPEELAIWRRVFEDARERSTTSPKVGRMKLQPAVRVNIGTRWRSGRAPTSG